jgi:hypothetical protein
MPKNPHLLPESLEWVSFAARRCALLRVMNAHGATESADLSASFLTSCKLRMILCVFSIGREVCIARVSAFGIQARPCRRYPQAATQRA